VWGINASGQIAGYYFDSSGHTHGFLDSGGQYTVIDPPGATNTYVVGIHKKGQVAGFSDNGGFLDDHRTYTTINPPGSGPGTVVTGINSKGELVGYFTESSGGGEQGFLYNGGAYTVVDFPGASLTHPAGINDKGQIVGIYMDNTGHDHGFIDDHGHYMTIHPPRSGLAPA